MLNGSLTPLDPTNYLFVNFQSLFFYSCASCAQQSLSRECYCIVAAGENVPTKQISRDPPNWRSQIVSFHTAKLASPRREKISHLFLQNLLSVWMLGKEWMSWRLATKLYFSKAISSWCTASCWITAWRNWCCQLGVAPSWRIIMEDKRQEEFKFFIVLTGRFCLILIPVIATPVINATGISD